MPRAESLNHHYSSLINGLLTLKLSETGNTAAQGLILTQSKCYLVPLRNFVFRDFGPELDLRKVFEIDDWCLIMKL